MAASVHWRLRLSDLYEMHILAGQARLRALALAARRLLIRSIVDVVWVERPVIPNGRGLVLRVVRIGRRLEKVLESAEAPDALG
jgi:hypothetical protein